MIGTANPPAGVTALSARSMSGTLAVAERDPIWDATSQSL